MQPNESDRNLRKARAELGQRSGEECAAAIDRDVVEQADGQDQACAQWMQRRAGAGEAGSLGGPGGARPRASRHLGPQ